MTIEDMTLDQFNKAIKAGAYAWPGGYAVLFLCKDSGVICFDCARKEQELIRSAIREPEYRDHQWQVVASFINWEDPALVCEHCNKVQKAEYCD